MLEIKLLNLEEIESHFNEPIKILANNLCSILISKNIINNKVFIVDF